MARHEALRALQILDTPRESAFDGAVELAKIVCGTTSGLISLIDRDRQWFKAGFGFDVDETPIEHSICVHCLDTDAVVEIKDLTNDERTRRNPLVTGKPNLRFYAGASISGPDGIKVGALCVLDNRPRPEGLTKAQTGFLLSRAAEVSGLLTARHAMILADDNSNKASKT